MDTKDSISSTFTKSTNLKYSSLEHTDPFQNEGPEISTRKPINVQLEPPLAEKLAKKRAVADELEEKLQILRAKFDEKVILAESTKQELKRREMQLIHSVQNIDGYMQEMYSLKKDAEEMYERHVNISKESEVREQSLLEQCIDVSMKRNTASALLDIFKPVKTYLEDVVYDFPQMSTTKQLVNDFLVLNLLHEDLLRKDKERLEEEERLTRERRKIVESARAHPMTVLEKEDTLHRLKAQVKEVNAYNTELRQQIDNTMSTQMKEELLWYDTERWIGKLYESIREVLPPQMEDTEEANNTLEKLQKICEFVKRGRKISKRLKDKLLSVP